MTTNKCCMGDNNGVTHYDDENGKWYCIEHAQEYLDEPEFERYMMGRSDG